MAVINYMQKTMEAARQSLGEDASLGEVVHWLFECGIAHEGRAARAQIKKDMEGLVAQGVSKNRAAIELTEKHPSLGEDRIRSIAYEVDGPTYLSASAFLKIKSDSK